MILLVRYVYSVNFRKKINVSRETISLDVSRETLFFFISCDKTVNIFL